MHDPPSRATSEGMNDTIADLVRKHDPDRFLTALFAPPAHRDALMVLYAFDHELARARTVASDPHLALIRLHWWREVVEGAVKRHEIATPLTALLTAGHLTPSLLGPIVDAHEVETEPAIETLDAWREWLLAGDGGVAVAAAFLLGASEPETFRAAGAAFGAARVVRWNRALAARGRCLLPADVLGAEGLTPEAAIAEPGSPGVRRVLLRLAAEGRAFLGPRRRVPRGLVAAALPAVLARRDLGRGADAISGPRGLGDRLAVVVAGTIGWV